MKYLHTKKKIYNELINLGLKKGMYINLKCSYVALGNLEGGPMSLIEILLDIIKENGLLVTDSFVNCYALGSKAIKKNVINNNTMSYAGLIANTILKHNNCFRSNHPIQKFGLIGDQAYILSIQHNKNSYAYDILKKLTEEQNSFNLRIGPDNKVIGVGTTHVASGILNIEKYERKLGVLYQNSEKKYELFERNWIGLCKNSLINLNTFYDENPNIIKKRGKLGSTKGFLTNMKNTLKEEMKLFKKNKENLYCENKLCYECFTFKDNYKKHFNFFTKNLINVNLRNIKKLLLDHKSLQPTFRL